MLERDTADRGIADRFKRSTFVKSLVDLLADRNRHAARGFVVGLTGPWGSGKSQVMLYVEDELKKAADLATKAGASLIVVRFNPWLHAGQNDLLRQFFTSVRDEIKKLNDPTLQGVVSKADGVKSFARKFTGALKAIPVVGAGAADLAAAALAESSLEAEKEHFAKGLLDAKASVIVLVDEIDRLSDQEIREIAQTVKSVADFPMFSYLLAYDPDRVAKALGRDDTKLGYQYLEKIVQVQARLPRVDPASLVNEISRQILPIVLSDHRPGDRQDKRPGIWMEVIQHLVPDIISTPRDARRLAAAMALRWPLLHQEVNSFDLLRYCALEARVPILSERIQNRTPRITVDGSRELRRRFEAVQPAAECVAEILGEYQNDKPLRDLLVYLFPALREGGSEEITRDDDRLCYETPLLSLLNYGPIAGTIPRAQAEAALQGGPSAVSDLLTGALRAGRMRHAVLRLRRLYRDLEQSGTLDAPGVALLWKGVGEFFDRPMTADDISNWDSWLDLTHVFVRGALRNYTQRAHLTPGFVKDLLAARQIHLPARILMFHIEAHGLHGIERNPLLIPALTIEQTKELLPEASRVIADLLSKPPDPKWRMRSVVPLWVLRAGDADGKRWSTVRDLLRNPKSPEHLDGILILAMRHWSDKFLGTTLPEELDLQRIARQGQALQNPEPELRTSTDIAYQFLRSQLRTAKLEEAPKPPPTLPTENQIG